MAIQEALKTISLPAAAGMQNSQFRFVKLNTLGQATLADAANEHVIGVLINRPGQNDTTSLTHQARVATFASGILKVVLGGVVTANDLLSTDANGAAVVSGGAANSFVAGKALTSGIAGDIVEMIPSGSFQI